MTLRIVLTDGSGVSGLTGVFGAFLRSSNLQIQQAVTAAAASATAAAGSAVSADQSAQAAAGSAAQSENSAQNSDTSAQAAALSESNAAASESAADAAAAAALASQTAAGASANNANVSAGNASASAILAQQWATQMGTPVGGVDYSAKWYAAQAAASAASIALPIVASSGGTGRTSLLANAVLAGDGTNPVKQIGPGTNGQMLIGVTSGAPVFGNNPTITGGTIDNAVIGGTTPKAATFTGATIKGTNPNLVLDDNAAGGYPEIIWKKNGVQQWGLYGDNATPAFYLIRFNASGTYVATPWSTNWNTGVTTFETRPIFGTNTPFDTGNTVPIANGGTGANDAPTAVNNLGLGTLAGKNLLVNGSCEIQQGTAASFSNATTSNGYGVCDQWRTVMTLTTGVILSGNNNTLTDPISNVAKRWVFAQATTAISSISATGYCSGIHQIVEGLNSYHLPGRQVTLSFLFRASVTGLYTATIKNGDSTWTCVSSFNYTAPSGGAQQIVVTFPAVPSAAASGLPQSTNPGLIVYIGALSTQYSTSTLNTWQNANLISATGVVNWGATANNAIWATDIKAEVGANATPFVYPDYFQELARCQRFYCLITLFARSYAPVGSAAYNTPGYFPTRMRGLPTATFISNGTVLNSSGNTFSPIDGTAGRFEIISITTGDFYNLGAVFSLNARF